MSRTLSLVDGLLARAQSFHHSHQTEHAVHLLRSVTRFTQDEGAAHKAHTRLGMLLLERHQFSRARRHLVQALRHDPNNARLHYFLASALKQEERGDIFQAMEHYRTSLDLDPRQPDCLAEYGLLALALGFPDEGINALRQAVDLAPGDPIVLGWLLEGLLDEKRYQEAQAAIRNGQFRNPRDSRFRDIWNNFQFRLLRQKQSSRRPVPAIPKRSMVLRFTTTDSTNSPVAKRVRKDGPSRTALPNRWIAGKISDHRHAL